MFGVSSGAAVHAGRLGYRYGGEILEATADGWITAARLDLPGTAAYARVEVDGRAWRKGLDESAMAVSPGRARYARRARAGPV